MEDSKVGAFQIDRDVPIPEVQLVPLDEMEVGDSIMFPSIDRKRIISRAAQLKRRKSKTFTVKVIDEHNARVWRIK